jgi:hypothetical protein
MPQARRSASLVLMMALMLSLGAQCLVGQAMTTAQMACCAGTDHDCDGMGARQDCCPSERAEQAQLVKQTLQVMPPVAVLTSAMAALVRPPQTHSAFDLRTTPLKGSSPPKYILLATFLI